MFKVTGRPDISVTNKYNIHNWLDRIESVDWRTCSFVAFFLYQLSLYVSLLQNTTIISLLLYHIMYVNVICNIITSYISY